MKVAIDVAGFSAAESDGFRRAMGTWRSRREMEKLHARFVDGCIDAQRPDHASRPRSCSGRSPAFASFGFNKSHAAAFARTAYESAFLKLFYPAQFVTGLINAQPMGFYPVEVLINDAKRHGVAGAAGRHQPEPLPDDDRVGRACPTSHSPTAPASTADRSRSARSACVVPDRADARPLGRASSALGYGIRLGLHLVKGIGEAEGEQLDAEVARSGPFRRWPTSSRERSCRGGRRAADPRRRARFARTSHGASCCGSCARLPAAARRPDGRPRRAASRSTCACRRPMRPICRHRPSSNGWATATRSCRSTRAGR